MTMQMLGVAVVVGFTAFVVVISWLGRKELTREQQETKETMIVEVNTEVKEQAIEEAEPVLQT